jgi:phage terminase large subunit-like protein
LVAAFSLASDLSSLATFLALVTAGLAVALQKEASGAENNYSVCTTWGVADNAYYLLWLWRDRVEFPELKKRMRWLAEQWNPTQILVEDRASGQSLIQELRTRPACRSARSRWIRTSCRARSP